VSAYEIQTQQLQTILTKRANDSRAAGQATNEAVAQVSISFFCAVSAHTSRTHFGCSPNGKQAFELF